MITFLPFPDFKRSAQCLDNQRLNGQRRECLILLNSIRDNNGWIKHPIAKMWKRNVWQLCQYSMEICVEGYNRGFQDSTFDKFLTFSKNLLQFKQPALVLELNTINGVINKQLPPWWGDIRLHQSHQSRLLSKKPEHYLQYFSNIPIFLDYYWPV